MDLEGGQSIRAWDDVLGWALLWFWPLSNLLMLATPLVFWFSGQRMVRKWTLVMGAATLVNASAFFLLSQEGRGFKVGYYLWYLSFAVATMGLYLGDSRWFGQSVPRGERQGRLFD
jgi:hypothetical protein